MHAQPNFQKRLTNLSLVLLLLIACLNTQAAVRRPASVSRSTEDAIKKAQALSDQAKTDEAVRILSDAVAKETTKDGKALTHFALAMILFRGSKDADTETQLNEALKEGLREPEYASYYLGLLHKKDLKTKIAKDDFEKVIGSKAPQLTELDARFQLADIFMTEKDFKSARTQYLILQKKMKASDSYPEILFNLMRSEKRAGSSAQVCKIARELYSKFPVYPLLKDWGPQLNQNTVDGEKIVCSASPKDYKTRIRRLQLGGEADRAAKELSMSKGGTEESLDEEGPYGVDSMLANHLANEGQTEQAMKLMLRHYETQHQRPPYLMLLGKVASRAGEYQTAIGAYQRAYDLSPRSKDAVNALFQAAFTSYQIQDYDGATRRFEQVIKAFPGSRLKRDAEWHLAWMRYLRGDSIGAFDSFNRLAKAPKEVRRRRRRGHAVIASDALSADRLKYWSAMSLYKLGRNDEATAIFQNLVRDPAIGYYSILAYYRLGQVPGAKIPPGVESRLGLKKASDGGVDAPSEEEIRTATEAVEAAAAEAGVAVAGVESTSTDPNDAAADDDDDSDASETAEADTTDESDKEVVDEKADVKGSFKDTTLAARFERARDLSLVGIDWGARRELSEIEKRARRPEDRKLLMNEYALVQNYNRSSTIGDLGFSAARLRGGLRGDGRQYWEFAYPRAWEPSVLAAMKSTSVPEELIWGIMRAESQYRPEVQSPVGAMGLMQVMPFTGKQVASLMSWPSFQTRSLLEPDSNIKLGSRYLQRLLEKFSGSVPLVAAGYNAGPHRVHAWVRNFGSLSMDEFIEHIPFVETRNYVKKVTRNYQIYSLLYSGGAHNLRWLVQPVGVEVDEHVPTKEVW